MGPARVIRFCQDSWNMVDTLDSRICNLTLLEPVVYDLSRTIDFSFVKLWY